MSNHYERRRDHTPSQQLTAGSVRLLATVGGHSFIVIRSFVEIMYSYKITHYMDSLGLEKDSFMSQVILKRDSFGNFKLSVMNTIV